MKIMTRLSKENIAKLFSKERFKAWVESKPDDYVFPGFSHTFPNGCAGCLFDVYIQETTAAINCQVCDSLIELWYENFPEKSKQISPELYLKFWQHSEMFRVEPSMSIYKQHLSKQSILERLKVI